MGLSKSQPLVADCQIRHERLDLAIQPERIAMYWVWFVW